VEFQFYLWCLGALIFCGIIAALLFWWAEKQKRYYKEHPEVAAKIQNRLEERKAEEIKKNQENMRKGQSSLWENLLGYTFFGFIVFYVIDAMHWWKEFGWGIAIFCFLVVIKRTEDFVNSLYSKIGDVSYENKRILELLDEINEKIDDLNFKANDERESA